MIQRLILLIMLTFGLAQAAAPEDTARRIEEMEKTGVISHEIAMKNKTKLKHKTMKVQRDIASAIPSLSPPKIETLKLPEILLFAD